MEFGQRGSDTASKTIATLSLQPGTWIVIATVSNDSNSRQFNLTLSSGAGFSGTTSYISVPGLFHFDQSFDFLVKYTNYGEAFTLPRVLIRAVRLSLS